MKKNSGMFFGLPCWRVGAVLLVLCAFHQVSRADIIVDNTGYDSGSSPGAAQTAQVFTMGSSDGNISSLTLVFNTMHSTGSEDVQVWNATSGGPPTSSLYDLGNISFSGNAAITITIDPSSNPLLLSANGTYAIVIGATGPTGLQWDYSSNSGTPGGTGQFGGGYLNFGDWIPTGGNPFVMNLQTSPVPEVPTTGAVMGFGALAIALGHTLRRKLRSTVSCNA